MAGSKVLVLGGGLQGRAVVEDLERRSRVDEITVADRDLEAVLKWLSRIEAKKTSARRLDAADPEALRAVMAEGFDLVIGMLPVQFTGEVMRAAIDAGVHLVNANYAHSLRDLDGRARSRGVTVMAEAGFDPGIDLVIASRAGRLFDDIEVLVSYAGGIPAPECRDSSPISYKVSWNFDGVLRSYRREARIIVDGKERRIAPGEIFDPRWTREVTFPPLGKLEAFVNGDAVEFVGMLRIRGSVKTAARYALRWPGHCAFWRRIAALGLLEEAVDPQTGFSPREILRRTLEPRLRYGEDERDMAVLRVDAVGKTGGKSAARRWEMIDFRDLQTGLMAMNRTVGYTASIIAGMILDGAITTRGVCSPLRDVPAAPFFEALSRRGITIVEKEIDPSEVL